jgi:cysteine desulfurase
MARVYLDHNATTQVRPDVLEAMLPYFGEHFGNASSVHAFGQEARAAVEDARAQVAAFLNASPAEIVLTGGGTESDNLAVIGGAHACASKGKHVVTTSIEHDAVRQAADVLEQEGFQVTRVAPLPDGRVTAEAIEAALRPDTILVSVMASNNETGVIQPMAEIGAVCAKRGVPFHTDAVQAAGKIPIDVSAWQATLATITGHKFYGPKGAGALYVRRGFKCTPLQVGGEHERGRRAGTENVPSIVALGAACTLAKEQLAGQAARWRELRARLLDGLQARVGPVQVNGHAERRLPNTLNICVPGVVGEEVLACATGVAASTGSACHAGRTEPSPVLLAMGVDPTTALGALRLSLGRWTTAEEIDGAVETLSAAILAVRSGSDGASPADARPAPAERALHSDADGVRGGAP